MTSVEKARDLISKFGIEIALLCVDEILTELNNERSIYEDEAHRLDRLHYWNFVKYYVSNY